jgi:phosphonate transport system substrate-binding protein
MRLHPLCLSVLVAALAAWPAQAYTPGVLRIGFEPFKYQPEMLRRVQPIVRMLSKEMGMEVQPIVEGDYPSVVQAMKAGKLDASFFTPMGLVLAERSAGARVVLQSLFRGKSCYHSAIVTRTDSPIKRLQDLKGKSFAFVDPISSSGSVFPKLMLMDAGIKPDKDLARYIYTGGHDAAILAVLHRKVDAAATFAIETDGHTGPWQDVLGPEANHIRVIAYSAPIPNGPLAVSKDLDAAVVERLKKGFMAVAHTKAGRAELEKLYMDDFQPAKLSDYIPLRKAFERLGMTLN